MPAGSDLTVVPVDGRLPEDPHFCLTPVGLEVHGAPSYERWDDYGLVLWGLGQAATWAVGDWIEYGEARYGEKYAAAQALTLRAPEALMKLSYVSRRFPISRRRKAVGWSLHADVAALPPDEADALLEAVEREGLTRVELRERLRARRELEGPEVRVSLQVPLPATIREVLAFFRMARKDWVVRVDATRTPAGLTVEPPDQTP
jgi:hypothetical protein